MHVDQAGKQRLAGEVDMPDIGAPAHGARIAIELIRPSSPMKIAGLLDIAAGLHVEIAIGGDDDLFRGGRRGTDAMAASPINMRMSVPRNPALRYAATSA